MKKTIAIIFIFICFSGNAQTIRNFTESFDSVFSHIDKSGAKTGILYNRVIPFSNATSFNSLINNVDTITYDDFFQTYYELYLSAFDPSANILPNIDILENNIDADTQMINI